MGLREAMTAGLARQLGNPRGLRGRVVGSQLNRHNAGAVTAAVEALALRGGETAADIGFGGGFGLELLLGSGCREVHGIDISTTMLARARRHHRRELATGRLRLVEGSLTALPLPDGGLDAAITVNTVYFVADLPAAMAELARVLTPGGRAVIGFGDPAAMAAMSVTRHGFRIRPVAELEATAAGAGLESRHSRVGEAEDAFHLLAVACSR